MIKKLIVGVLGSGVAAHQRCRAVKAMNNPRLILKGNYDTNDKNSSLFSKEFFTHYYKSFENMLQDKEINTIFVCVPNKYHFEMSKISLIHNKNVVCEYPLVIDDYNKAKDLLEIAKEKKLFLHVGQTINYDPEILFINKVMEKIGKPIMGYRCRTFGKLGSMIKDKGFKGDYGDLSKWYLDKNKSGGWIIAAHYHGIQVFRKLFGEVSSLYSADTSTNSIVSGSVLLKHGENASSIIQWGLPFFGQKFNLTLISGSQGSVEISGDDYLLKTRDSTEDGKIEEVDTFFNDLEALLDEIDNKKEMEINTVDMLLNLKVAFLAQRSAEEETAERIII